MRQIVLDTETTGLRTEDGHRVIELGCVELVKRRLTGRSFHHYFNPQRSVDAGALQVHGLSNQFLADKPLFSSLIQEFMDFVAGAELVIHNAVFDMGFLEQEFKLANAKIKLIETCQVLDTLTLARKMHPGQKNSLDALCKRYHVDNSHREYHGALLDAEILARVYLAMTGGQVSLFSDETDTNFTKQQHTQNQQGKTALLAEIDQITVIQADETEKKLHAEYVEKLAKKSGKKLWEVI